MGRHSKPDPEDSVDDLSDGHAAEQQHWEDISGSYDYPGVDQPDDGPLSSEGHYPPSAATRLAAQKTTLTFHPAPTGSQRVPSP